MNIIDPQGLALPPSIDPKLDLADWLMSPDGGALRMDQAQHIAGAIRDGKVPHVTLESADCIELDIPPAMMTVDGGLTWREIK